MSQLNQDNNVNQIQETADESSNQIVQDATVEGLIIEAAEEPPAEIVVLEGPVEDIGQPLHPEILVVQDPNEQRVEILIVEAPEDPPAEILVVEALEEPRAEILIVEAPEEPGAEILIVQAPEEPSIEGLAEPIHSEILVVEAPEEPRTEILIVEAPEEPAEEILVGQAPEEPSVEGLAEPIHSEILIVEAPEEPSTEIRIVEAPEKHAAEILVGEAPEEPAAESLIVQAPEEPSIEGLAEPIHSEILIVEAPEEPSIEGLAEPIRSEILIVEAPEEPSIEGLAEPIHSEILIVEAPEEPRAEILIVEAPEDPWSESVVLEGPVENIGQPVLAEILVGQCSEEPGSVEAVTSIDDEPEELITLNCERNVLKSQPVRKVSPAQEVVESDLGVGNESFETEQSTYVFSNIVIAENMQSKTEVIDEDIVPQKAYIVGDRGNIKATSSRVISANAQSNQSRFVNSDQRSNEGTPLNVSKLIPSGPSPSFGRPLPSGGESGNSQVVAVPQTNVGWFSKRKSSFRLVSWSLEDASNSFNQLSALLEDSSVDVIALHESKVDAPEDIPAIYGIAPSALEDRSFHLAPGISNQHYGCCVTTKNNEDGWKAEEEILDSSNWPHNEACHPKHRVVKVKVDVALDAEQSPASTLSFHIVSLHRPTKAQWKARETKAASEDFDDYLKHSVLNSKRGLGEFVIVCGNFHVTFEDNGGSVKSIQSTLLEQGFVAVNQWNTSNTNGHFVFVPKEFLPCLSVAPGQTHSQIALELDLKAVLQLQTIFQNIATLPSLQLQLVSFNVKESSSTAFALLPENGPTIVALQETRMKSVNALQVHSKLWEELTLRPASSHLVSAIGKKRPYRAGVGLLALHNANIQNIALFHYAPKWIEINQHVAQAEVSIEGYASSIVVVSLLAPPPLLEKSKSWKALTSYLSILFEKCRTFGRFVVLCCDFHAWYLLRAHQNLYDLMAKYGLIPIANNLSPKTTTNAPLNFTFVPYEYQQCVAVNSDNVSNVSHVIIDLVRVEYLHKNFANLGTSTVGFPIQ